MRTIEEDLGEKKVGGEDACEKRKCPRRRKVSEERKFRRRGRVGEEEVFEERTSRAEK